MGIEKVSLQNTATIPTNVAAPQSKVKAMATSLFTKENAIFAVKVAGGIAAVGGALALGGMAMEHLGNAAQGTIFDNLSSTMIQGGQHVFTAGKYTAYSVLVPAYMVGYQLPRWIITTGAPKAAEFINTYVVQPGVEKIQWLANKSVEVMTYVHQQVIRPIVERALIVFNDYIVPVATWVKGHVVTLIEYSRQYIIDPILNLAQSTLKLAKIYLYEPMMKGIEWLGTRISEMLHLAHDYIAVPLMNLAYRIHSIYQSAVQWVGDQLVTPLLNLAQKAGEIAAEYLIKPFVNGLVYLKDTILPPLEQAANTVWSVAKDYLLNPAYEIVKWAGTKVFEVVTFSTAYAYNVVSRVALAVSQYVSQATWWVSENMIQPVTTTAYTVVNNVYTAAARDISKLISVVTS